MSDSLVSIITVNYQSELEIEQSIVSILENCKFPFEYIIVSNSKLEQSFKQRISKLFEHTIFVEMDANKGFATACNKGAELASSEYLFFLNPDTRFKNDSIAELIKCYKKQNQELILGPKTFSSNGEVSATAKEFITPRLFLYFVIPFLRFFISDRKIGGHFIPKKSSYVPVLNGHALFMKKKTYINLRGMDEQFFMYWEENDLCIRAQKKGIHTFYCDNAEITHIKGTSTNPFFVKMEIEKHRSQKKYVKKHLPSYVYANRISGLIGYLWRSLFGLFSFKKNKIIQHFSLLKWYLFTYD